MIEMSELCAEKFKVINHRIDDLEEEVKDIKELTLAINTVNSKVDNLKEDVGEIKDCIKAMTKQPSENWNKFKMAVACAIATGLVGVIIALIFK